VCFHALKASASKRWPATEITLLSARVNFVFRLTAAFGASPRFFHLFLVETGRNSSKRGMATLLWGEPSRGFQPTYHAISPPGAFCRDFLQSQQPADME
jgi:hypothetical protein